MTHENARSLSCEEVEEVLDAYLDGILVEPRHSQISDHLESCIRCTEELVLAKRVKHALGSLPAMQLPEAATDRIRHEVDRRERRGPARLLAFPANWRGMKPGRVAISLMAAAAVAAALWLPSQFVTEPLRPSAVELKRIETDVKWALAYLNQLNTRTGRYLAKDVIGSQIVEPVQQHMLSPLTGASEPAPF